MVPTPNQDDHSVICSLGAWWRCAWSDTTNVTMYPAGVSESRHHVTTRQRDTRLVFVGVASAQLGGGGFLVANVANAALSWSLQQQTLARGSWLR
jgi:hypothetical protein